MFQGRPELTAQSGTYDTTDTAGVSARFGRVQDTAPVFDDQDAPEEPGGTDGKRDPRDPRCGELPQ